ncbi:hypothetical protein SAMN05880582_10640 [Rhizobium sp. RU20A]|uniref:hypothetical protein n=1 Tax=Rhizobium sp. RU20A TaxID=1907412 RepID=UPI00095654D2|nr:hypothetical protein [Rhizobium sp. RU20A]SIR06363.1 hypothetical protein SAMN05880582_10640 [Rhizobium sp. RU20A]
MTSQFTTEDWACFKAREIVEREGMTLVRAARGSSRNDLHESSLRLARAIAATLIEASVDNSAYSNRARSF